MSSERCDDGNNSRSRANDDARIRAARLLVAAPIIVAFADNSARDGGGARDKILSLMRDEWKQTGEIVMRDSALAPYDALHLRMSKVPRGYRINIAVPAGFERALREKFALFRAAARSFWREIADDMTRARCDEEPRGLCETESAVYWYTPRANDDEFWVGIVGYFTDSSGKKYMVDGKRC
jgi:hypothetical protein